MQYSSIVFEILLFLCLVNGGLLKELCNYSMICEDKSHKESNNSNSSMVPCINITETEATDVFKIGFNQCEDQKSQYCNVFDAFIQPNNVHSKCVDRPKNLLSYPGGKCTTNDDCRYGKCVNGKCRDSDIAKECFRDDNCPIGTACFVNDNSQVAQCKELLKLNAECSKSTQCQLNHLCADGHCIEMYSIEDGKDISKFKDNTEDNLDLLCQSGFAVEIKKSIICARLKLQSDPNDKCKEDCTYSLMETNVVVPNSCRCGYNKQRSKHCILGSSDPLLEEFISARKSLISDESYRTYCHTLERFSNDYCVEKLKSDRTVAFRRKVQAYNNLKIMAMEHHRLINADDCIKTVVFDYDTTPVVSDKRQCASFVCDEKLTNCAFGTNPLNEEGNSITLKMNDKLCSDKEKCQLSSKKGIEFIYENYTITGECQNRSLSKCLHLPGEDCEDDSDCYHTLKCNQNKKCQGNTLNERCFDTIDCNSGLYCFNQKCIPQKMEGESCVQGWDCLNYLGCYINPKVSGSHCMPFGQVSDVDLSQIKDTFKRHEYHNANANDNPDEIGPSLMCKTGQLAVSKTRCGMFYYDTTHEEMTNADGDNFIECQADSNCSYVDNYKTSLVKKCECGYNSKGKGYCPLPNSVNEESWKELNRVKIEMTDNKCHSYSRFNCYMNQPSKYLNEIELKTTKAHLFKEAVPCAFRLLESQRAISGYYYLIGLIVIMLL